MFRRTASIVLFSAVLQILFVSPSPAQRLRVHTYTEEDGLPGSIVWDITQDRDGRMWFATRTGVASYDGFEWTAHGKSEGLPWNNQIALRPSPDGGVWSLSGGAPFRVLRYDGRRWTTLPASPEPSVSATSLEVLEIDGRSTVAVGTAVGLFLWDETWRHLDDSDGLPGPDVRTLHAVAGHLYIGTTAGFAVLTDGRVRDLTRRIDAPTPGILGLASSPIDGSLWLIGQDWLGRIDTEGAFKLERRLDEPLPFQTLTPGAAIEIDAHGGVYFGNPTVLFYHHPAEKFSRLDRTSGLTTAGATRVFLDREQNVWVAGLRGATKIVSRRFLTMRAEHGLYEDEVTAVLERSDGRFVLGHPTGLSIVSGTAIDHLSLPVEGADTSDWSRVLDLDEDAAGNVWIAASLLGLGRLQPSGQLDWQQVDRRHRSQVTSVRTTEDGRVWVALGIEQLWTMRDGELTAVPIAPEAGYIRRLFRSPSGGLYLATGGSGLGRFEDGRFDGLVQGTAPEENWVYAVLADPDGTVWVGTVAGLMQVRGDRLVRARDGPRITRPVYFLLRDGAGRLWCGTDNGVVRWTDGERREYTIADGLAGRETNRAAGIVDSTGRVWIGTGSGLSIYRDGWEKPDPAPPLLQVASMLAGGTTHTLTDDLRLGAGLDDVTFRFSALSFVDENRIIVRSRLEGLDEEWRSTVGPSRRELRYARLPPGTYRLDLQAESADGVTSEVYRSAAITVVPPFYERPAVLAVAALFAVALLYFLLRYVTQRRYALNLEAEVERRIAQTRAVEEELTRARRLESLAVFAGGVAHDFNNLLTVILGCLSVVRTRLKQYGADTRPVDVGEEAVSRATKLTGQFLTFARGGSPVRKVHDVGAILQESAALVLAGTPIRSQLEIPANLWCAEVDDGQIAQVFNNLLLNAVQAMPDGGAVRVEATNLERAPEPLPPNRAIRVVVEDDGPGISEKIRDRIFDPFFTTKEEGHGLGLSSAYSIINRHGGILTVSDGSTGGTRFEIHLMATEDRPLPAPASAPAPAAGSGRVLVMDDDEDVLVVVRAMLEDLGYEVCCTGDGESAVEAYAEARGRGAPFDVVILDLTIRGGMGGTETIERLNELDPDVCAIVASGYSDDPVMADHEGYLFRAALAKPFSRTELARALERVLQPQRKA